MDRPLAIEFIIDSGIVGGAETQLASLCRHLQQTGHRPSVLFLQRVGPLVDELESASIPVSFVRSAPGGVDESTPAPVVGSARSLLTYFRFGRRRQGPAPDVVHAMLDGSIAVSHLLRPGRKKPPAFVAGVLGMRIGRSSRLDVGWAARARLLARNLSRADAVICNAPHLGSEIIADFDVDPRRLHVIVNGVDIPSWSADVMRQPPRGVVVANFHSYKGYDVLVDAMSRMSTQVPLHLCGTGDVRGQTIARAATLGLASTITFVDPPADVPAELRSAQFGVHASRTEGMSNAILEQMAAGLPVVASDVGGNSLLIEHGVNGLLVPAGDAGALARAITTLACDVDLRVRMGAASRRRAEELSWDRCAQAHVDLYRNLLADI